MACSGSLYILLPDWLLVTYRIRDERDGNICSISEADCIIKGRLISYTKPFYEVERKSYMSGRCEICERKPMYGNNVNFSQKRTRRRFVLNVQRRRIEINGVRRKVNICTRCLRTMDKLPKER
jgi:large subunit ribosomal protein L28